MQVFTAAGEIDATNIALVNDLLANDLYLEREADAFDKVTLTSETTADFSDTDFTTDEVAIFSDVNYTNIDGTYTFNVNFNGVTLAYQATGDASSLTFANHVYMVKAADGFDYSSSGPQEINILGDPYDLAEGDTLVIKNYSLSYGE